MKIEILERDYKAKDRLKDLIEKKLGRFDKYLGDEAQAKVVLSSRKDRYKMEISIKSRGLFVRSEVETDNMYANLDLCLAKMERQIVKYSDKIIDRKRNFDIRDLEFFDMLPEFKQAKITKHKLYDLEPMTEKEAIEQLDLLGNTFYVFINVKTQKVAVCYKRDDGDYGVIDTNY